MKTAACFLLFLMKSMEKSLDPFYIKREFIKLWWKKEFCPSPILWLFIKWKGDISWKTKKEYWKFWFFHLCHILPSGNGVFQLLFYCAITRVIVLTLENHSIKKNMIIWYWHKAKWNNCVNTSLVKTTCLKTYLSEIAVNTSVEY